MYTLKGLLSKRSPYKNSKHSIGRIIINSSIIASSVLVFLLVVYDVLDGPEVKIRAYIGIGGLVYLIIVRLFFSRGKELLAHWLLITFYGTVALATLFFWGINTTAGVLALGFIIILGGVLLGAKRMPLIIGILSVALLAIQLIHTAHIYTPDLQHLNKYASFGDAIAYIVILSTFSLAIWLSMKRSEYALRRARQAEKKLRTQKEKLKQQLAQESAKLRANQLKEMQQLYSFAALGQNTAATLHELSNHLSILGVDIEGFRDTNQHSKAVADAQESFTQITTMVKTVRRQLDTYDNQKSIYPYTILKRTLNDIQPLLALHAVSIRSTADDAVDRKLKIVGDPLALSHIFSILLKNAVEACAKFPEAEVRIHTTQTKALYRFTVSDNGIGVTPDILKSLFSPVVSNKPTGLGAGLFIARSLARTQLHGNLRLISNGERLKEHYLGGATFSLEIPISRRSS